MSTSPFAIGPGPGGEEEKNDKSRQVQLPRGRIYILVSFSCVSFREPIFIWPSKAQSATFISDANTRLQRGNKNLTWVGKSATASRTAVGADTHTNAQAPPFSGGGWSLCSPYIPPSSLTVEIKRLSSSVLVRNHR